MAAIGEAFIQIAARAPVLDCAQVVAQVQVARGLDAGKHSLLRGIGYDFAHVGHVPFSC